MPSHKQLESLKTIQMLNLTSILILYQQHKYITQSSVISAVITSKLILHKTQMRLILAYCLVHEADSTVEWVVPITWGVL